jgi:hypothetical protein
MTPDPPAGRPSRIAASLVDLVKPTGYLPSSFGWIRLLREVQAEPLAGPSIRRRPVAFSDFCQDPPLFTSARRQGRKEAWIDGHDVARHDGVLPVGVLSLRCASFTDVPSSTACLTKLYSTFAERPARLEATQAWRN